MPEYFFHIGLELFEENTRPPINLSQAFQALKPFASKHPRTSRNASFDRKKDIPTRLISEETIPSSVNDHRVDQVAVDAVDMESNDISIGIGTNAAGVDTKGQFEPVLQAQSIGEWGIVHLYRDTEETPGLYQKSSPLRSSDLWTGSAQAKVQPPSLTRSSPPKDEDCTILCLLAVPSYLTPKDFLAFVGQETRDAVKHFRMIRTRRLNRYMVLMKFRDGRTARQWQHEWNGKVFNSMEPETCHVVFVKSVEVMHNPRHEDKSLSFNTEPVPSSIAALPDPSTSKVPAASLGKPFAPPTPSLVELPTCPVCLERMDESTGLLTILCQHVFHCTCLEKWSGGGCPVCRYTYDDFSTAISASSKTKSKKYMSSNGEFEIDDKPAECEVCRMTEELWQCLICGYVGCGRYAGKHAYRHFEETRHTFALDLDSKRVWDYERDVYVHRIIADASSHPGEKLVELPGRGRDGHTTALEDVDQDIDMAKRENLAFEYTQLLTSQLDSQRVYFEEVVSRAADKASEASKRAEKAVLDAGITVAQFEEVSQKHAELQHKFTDLEKDSTRLKSRCQKLEDTNKELNKKYLEEKAFADSVSKRTKSLEDNVSKEKDVKLEDQKKRIQALEEDNATKEILMEALQEEHRDLRFRLDAEKKLREMVERGELDKEELEGATIEVGPAAPKKPSKGKGKRTGTPSTTAGQASTTTSSSSSSISNAQVSELERLLGEELKLSGNWNVAAAAQLLLEKGFLERKEEEGLYDGSDDAAEGAKKTSKSKKKKSKKKKKLVSSAEATVLDGPEAVAQES